MSRLERCRATFVPPIVCAASGLFGFGWTRRLSVLLLALLLGCQPRTGGAASAPEESASRKAAAVVAPPGNVRPPLPEHLPPGVAMGRRGAVSSAEANASDVGIEVMRRGGNAVDAAVAVGFALGVTHPSAGNLGGGGFMVVRLPDGKSVALDYREMAPGASHRDMYLDAAGNLTRDSRRGPRAAGIPGVVAGFARAHALYGTLPWAELVAPAVRLAREGWALDSLHAEGLSWVSDVVARYRDEAAADSGLAEALDATLATFRKPDGSSYQTGEVWKQPALAQTLQAIAQGGAAAFYGGDVARRMVAGMTSMGGIWSLDDLSGYRVVERNPIVFDYRGYQIATMPPPSAGGIVLRQILAAAEHLGLHGLDWDSAQRTHLYVEILRRTYADRNQLMGDPAFVDIPLQRLLDVGYVQQRMARVDPTRATPSSEVGAGVVQPESEQTTHFSVVDASGLAVANTYTLNGRYGAKVQIPGTGVTLNNEMDDFTAKVGAPNMFGLVQGAQNGIEPGKRMLSSMSPTIIARGGKLRAVVGSPGGPTITTTVAQIVMQMLDHGRTLEQAVKSPRVHHQWLPDVVMHERGLAPELARRLLDMGHELQPRKRIGHANCIEVDPATGFVVGVADVARNGGKAAAY